MDIRKWWVAFVVSNCALPLAWAVKPGEVAPDLTLRDCSGAEVRLSAYRHKRHAAILAQPPGAAMAAAVLDDTCRGLDALGFAVLFLASDAEENRKFLENTPTASLLVDPDGVVRRVLPGRVLAGADLSAFVRQWQSGKIVFDTSCARCHGEDGALHICEDVKPLVGIGKRLTEAQIREKLRIGEINDRDLLIRGQIYSRQDVDAVIAYIAGL